MRGHLPTWLPAGLGLIGAFHDTRGQAWAYWGDDRCREVGVFWAPFASPPPSPLARVGKWSVLVDAMGCGNYVLGNGRCLMYTVDVAGGSLVMNSMGIERSMGDRIVSGIPI